MKTTDYNQQAQAFLDRFGIKFRATLSDSKLPPWNHPEHEPHKMRAGHHYRVTLSKDAERAGTMMNNTYKRAGVYYLKREPARLAFDYWGSIADAEKGTHPSAYDVLACISSDTYCAESFEEWAGEFGESTDSIRALQTHRRCAAFAKRLNQFFTAEEIEALREIQ